MYLDNSFITTEMVSFSAVELAVKALNGRFFGGRKLKAEPYGQQMFDANDLSG